jgi:hypothetical protein
MESRTIPCGFQAPIQRFCVLAAPGQLVRSFHFVVKERSRKARAVTSL